MHNPLLLTLAACAQLKERSLSQSQGNVLGYSRDGRLELKYYSLMVLIYIFRNIK